VLPPAWRAISAVYGRGEERERYLALAEDKSYEGRLPDGTASVEAGVALVRAVFGYDGVQSILKAARRAAALEPERTSPRAALVRFGLGSGLYLSGDISQARKPLEEALELLSADQPLVRISVLSVLSLVNVDEGHLEEAEALAREARYSGQIRTAGDPPSYYGVHRARPCASQNAGNWAKPRPS
jgi:hypothetical protein